MVDQKLADSRALLARLTAAERARLAVIQRARQQRVAAEVARVSRDASRTALLAAKKTPPPTTSKTTTGKPASTPTGSSKSRPAGENAPLAQSPPLAKSPPLAENPPRVTPPPASGRVVTVLAFAKAQLGEPYVFGAAAQTGDVHAKHAAPPTVSTASSNQASALRCAQGTTASASYSLSWLSG